MARAADRATVIVVTVDPKSPIPPFEQLRLAIRRLVATGTLPVGSRLPTVRQLAADLRLAPGTVQRAFRELEAEGIIETRGRHGTHVKRPPLPPRTREREPRIREAAAAYAAIAAELGIEPAAALQHVQDALAT